MRLTGTSSFLPDSVRGTDGHREDRVGHVAGRQLGAQAAHDGGAQVVVERRARRERHEQHQLPHRPVGIVALEVHDEAVGDLGQRLDHRVEVAGAEAHAAAVERGVGAARDHAGAVVGEGDPVAVAPHARIVGEVRARGASRRRVAPEADRHRRHRLGDHELALHAGRARRCRRDRTASTAQPSSRQLISPARTGQQRHRAHEGGAHVGAAAHRLHLHAGARRRRAPTGSRRAAAAPRWSRRPAGDAAGGTTPALRHAMRNGALTPSTSTPVSAASRQSVVRSGNAGSPSNSTMVAPTSRPDTR